MRSVIKMLASTFPVPLQAGQASVAETWATSPNALTRQLNHPKATWHCNVVLGLVFLHGRTQGVR